MTYAADVLALAPLSYWKLDDAPGSTAADSAGTNTATTQGALSMGGTTGVAGIGGSAPSLDGVNDYLLLKNGALLAGRADFTIVAWVRTTDTTAPVYTERAGTGNDLIRLQVGAGGFPEFAYRDDGGTLAQAITSWASVTSSTTYRMVAARKQGSTLTVFKSGAPVGSATTAATSVMTNTGLDARAGTDRVGPSWLTGAISHLAVFGSALTDLQIWNLYKSGTPTTRPPAYKMPGPSWSVWNQVLPDTAPLHANSAGFVTEFNRLLGVYTHGFNDGNGYSVAPFIIQGSQHTKQNWQIQNGQSNPGGIGLYNALQGVPTPTNLQASAGTDHHVTVYDEETDVLYEGWISNNVMPRPTGFVATPAAGGGTLPVNTYRYLVVPFNVNGENRGTNRTGGTLTTTAVGRVDMVWDPLPLIAGCTGYNIYRSVGTVATRERIATINNPATTNFTDDGSFPQDPSQPIADFTLEPNLATTPMWWINYGGVLFNVTQSPGYYRGSSFNWGATATSLPVWAGTITAEETADAAGGNINAIQHAVAMALPIVEASGTIMWPAQRTDGSKFTANAIQLGTRFRFPASLDIASLPLTNFAKAYCRALQVYGAYPRDTTQGVAVAYIEDTTNLGRDYFTKFMAGKDQYSSYGANYVFAGVPWTQLQVVDPAHTQGIVVTGLSGQAPPPPPPNTPPPPTFTPGLGARRSRSRLFKRRGYTR